MTIAYYDMIFAVCQPRKGKIYGDLGSLARARDRHRPPVYGGTGISPFTPHRREVDRALAEKTEFYG